MPIPPDKRHYHPVYAILLTMEELETMAIPLGLPKPQIEKRTREA
jgi:hypothetical protein